MKVLNLRAKASRPDDVSGHCDESGLRSVSTGEIDY